MQSDGPIAAAQTDALRIFNAETAGRNGFTLTSLTATAAKSNWAVSSTVQFSATVPTAIMGVIGVKSMTVTGTSAAANGLPTFIDFYLLLDNTPSMGVGATPSDVSTMVNNTSDKCAFACHDLNNANNYYKLAKSLGVTMRIDVVRTATQKLMDTATATATYSNQYRMAIYTFGASASAAGLTTIASLTSNLATAKTQASSIDLMTVQGQNQNNDQDTNYDALFPAVNLQISNPGSGTSSAAPQKVLFFVSDGVADEYNPGGCTRPTTSGGRCQEPINLALCSAIKSRGIRIAVLYTTYLPLPTNPWYNTWIAPFASSIGSTMQSCASPDLYFEVSPTQGISEAMQALFERAVATARLTQ